MSEILALDAGRLLDADRFTEAPSPPRPPDAGPPDDQDHRREARQSLYQLALLSLDEGRNGEAEHHARRALGLLRAALGEGHPRTEALRTLVSRFNPTPEQSSVPADDDES